MKPMLKLREWGRVTQAFHRSFYRMRSPRLAVSIQGNTFRYVLTERGRVQSWAQIPFNPIFLRGGFIADRQGMGQMIRNALSGKGIPSVPVVAAFTGVQSIVRVIQLPNVRDIHPEQVLPREARRLMALNENVQYLFWQQVAKREKLQTFVAVVVPKEGLQGFLEALRVAGLVPTRVEVAPLCLVKDIPQGQAIVANVESDSIDIVIVMDSLPFLVRSLWLGDEPLTIDSAPARVAEELVRTISAHNDSNPENSLPPTLPIYLAGGFFTDDLTAEVGRETGHPVMPLIPSLEGPDGFPATAMAVNAGLLLGK